MSVELEPTELGFRRPFTHEVSQVLRIKNPNNDPVVFKVKTTAPKQYCVRPNSGKIDAGRDIKVQVLLQAMEHDPPPDARCKDKFLVQSIAVGGDKDFDNVASVWSHIEQTAKSSIQEKKIRVVFLPAEGSAATPTSKLVNGVNYHQEEPAMSSSPATEVSTPQQRGPRAEPPRSHSKQEEEAAQPASRGHASEPESIAGSVKSAISNAVPTSTEDLKSQLAAANATIARLKQQAEQGLRQRNVIGSGSRDSKDSSGTATTTVGTPQNVPSGVPVQVVAGLCLLSFLLAYFFF